MRFLPLKGPYLTLGHTGPQLCNSGWGRDVKSMVQRNACHYAFQQVL